MQTETPLSVGFVIESLDALKITFESRLSLLIQLQPISRFTFNVDIGTFSPELQMEIICNIEIFTV